MLDQVDLKTAPVAEPVFATHLPLNCDVALVRPCNLVRPRRPSQPTHSPHPYHPTTVQASAVSRAKPHGPAATKPQRRHSDNPARPPKPKIKDHRRHSDPADQIQAARRRADALYASALAEAQKYHLAHLAAQARAAEREGELSSDSDDEGALPPQRREPVPHTQSLRKRPRTTAVISLAVGLGQGIVHTPTEELAFGTISRKGRRSFHLG